MQIVCPNCETSYHLDGSALGPGGRSVRCVRCRMVWFAVGAGALAEAAAEPDMAQIGAAEAGIAPPGGWPGEVAVPPAASEPGNTVWSPDAPSAASAVATEPDASEAPAPSEAPVPVVESPALAPAGPAAAADEIIAPEDIETVAARRAREQAHKRRSAWPLFGARSAILALMLINLGLVAWRAEIVRLLPQTASFFAAIGLPVNLRGLLITDITTEIQTHEGVAVLLIEGRIVSAAKRTVEVPRLRFAARNAAGSEIYSWTALPGRSLLGPGEVLPFRSRLAAPPADTHDVLVRFFSRRDLAGGIE